MSSAERLLTLWMRVLAGVLLLAGVAVVMPFDRMSRANDALGLSPLADTPLTSYLTRSLSALYFYHGLLFAFLSSDIRRYRPLVGFMGWANVGFGAFMLALDLTAGMPMMWTLAEGPTIIGGGLVILLLLRASVSEPGSPRTRA